VRAGVLSRELHMQRLSTNSTGLQQITRRGCTTTYKVHTTSTLLCHSVTETWAHVATKGESHPNSQFGLVDRYPERAYQVGVLFDNGHISKRGTNPQKARVLSLTLNLPVESGFRKHMPHILLALTHTPKTLADFQCSTPLPPKQVMQSVNSWAVFLLANSLFVFPSFKSSRVSPPRFTPFSLGRMPTCITLSRYKTGQGPSWGGSG
jgi:hypothetical protein